MASKTIRQGSNPCACAKIKNDKTMTNGTVATKMEKIKW